MILIGRLEPIPDRLAMLHLTEGGAKERLKKRA